MKKISELNDSELCLYIDNRWKSSESVWDTVNRTYDRNLKAYTNEPEWLRTLPVKKSKVRDNRIFVNTEAVINALIANPPKPNIIPGRNTPESKTLAMYQEKFFQIKYTDRNVKEAIRKGLRNLYLSRLIILKPFWNTVINDFDVSVVDPRKVRFSKSSTKEENTDFAIEEVVDTVTGLMARFPAKAKEILDEAGEDEDTVLIENKEVTYQEAWCSDYLVCKYGTIILSRKPNPYWDWDGILITDEESAEINNPDVTQEGRRNTFANARNSQQGRVITDEKGAVRPVSGTSAYMFNHFDRPRKPYIFATAFNNENTPIGQTDIITQAIPLQEDIDETKRNITENARIVNGIIKVDSTVMDQSSANKLRFETGGVIWGKGVNNGVVREMGSPLPNFVLENLADSRKEIDDLMAASSAFRGVREGQETRGGRLALIDQSFLRLNEFVQIIDYVNNELFNWFYQLAKVNYTEHHYAKTLGRDRATEILTLIQDDFEEGTEVRIIAGKTLPEDRQFKFEQAQKDFELGVLAPADYLEAAGYDNPAEKARNKVAFDLNRPLAVGITPEELSKITPPPQPEPEEPKMSMKYEDLPPDGQVQMAAKAGIILNPQLVVAKELQKKKEQDTLNKKKEDSSMDTP